MSPTGIPQQKSIGLLWRDEEHGIKSRTLDAIVVREGETIQECLLEKTQAILDAKGFDELRYYRCSRL